MIDLTLVAGLIVREGDAVLLMKQQGPDDPEPFWAIPACALQPGEAFAEAAARELHEELGLEVTGLKRLLWVSEARSGERDTQLIATVFEAAGFVGEIDIQGTDSQSGSDPDPDGTVLEAAFFAPEEAGELIESSPENFLREPCLAWLADPEDCRRYWLYDSFGPGSEKLRLSVT